MNPILLPAMTLMSVVAGLGLLVQGVQAASSLEDEIVERIRAAGTVCVVGEDCAAGAATVAATASGGPQDAESIYNSACVTCHGMGVAGAPRLGNADDWAPRLGKGMEELYSSVINGLAPAMPAKGTCFTCTDDELRAVTDYMVSQVK